MKARITLTFALLLLAFIQNPLRHVSGTITNTTGQSLSGAHIQTPDGAVSATSDGHGRYQLDVPAQTRQLDFSLHGYRTQTANLPKQGNILNIQLEKANLVAHARPARAPVKSDYLAINGARLHSVMAQPFSRPLDAGRAQRTERYAFVRENNFRRSVAEPVSTFSIDVDRASYSNVRRFLNAGQMPPEDAVRIEELINYFDYNYPQPAGDDPVAVSTTLTDSPWNKGLKLLHIGLRARSVDTAHLPASNLVFLIDVSGSMSDDNKLPLVKQSFKMLTEQLRPQDKVSIVVYAGAAGMVLPPTSGSEKTKIRQALNNLEAGGSTAGEDGILLAYDLAAKHFVKNGNNRVILATDGDFNVGLSSENELQRLIEQKRREGIFLSVLGFGMGNYKDSMMETLADKGNGNYAYIDQLQEARKQLVEEFGGTLFTMAKDVKVQIEFNPRFVQAYRLIGYENRALQNEDFHDDKKDAGEMGAGHTVTAIYEIVPPGVQSSYLMPATSLRYQPSQVPDQMGDELLNLKIRYKNPQDQKSRLLEIPLKNQHTAFHNCSADVRFAIAVTEFGLLLRNSEFRGTASYKDVAARAQQALGSDQGGYRAEMVRLVKTAASIADDEQTARKN